MKYSVKKIYCPDCKRPVKGREEQKQNKIINVLCLRCGKSIYTWDGYTWRPTKVETEAEV